MNARRRPWSSRAISAAVSLALVASGIAFWPGLAPAASAAGVSIAPTASATWTTAEDFVANAVTTGERTTRSNLSTGTVPGSVTVGGDIAQIAVGANHAVARRTDGSVLAIGEIERGQANVVTWADIIDVAVGDEHTVGLHGDGTAVAVGLNTNGQCNVSGWSGITDVAAGYAHTVGLRADGTVVATGSNTSGQCNVGGWENIVAIDAGRYHTVGLKSDGTVVAVGSNTSGQCNVSDWTGVTAIAAGDSHTVALLADASCVGVGSTMSGTLDISGWSDVVAIDAGLRTTVGIRADGSVLAAGYYITGRIDPALGNANTWTEMAAVSASADFVVGLRTDGTCAVVGRLPWYGGSPLVWGPWLWDHLEPTAMGADHVVAILDGTRQVRVKDWHYSWEPVTPAPLPVVAIAAGEHWTAYKYMYGEIDVPDWEPTSFSEFAGTGYTNTAVTLSAGRGSLYGVMVDGGVATQYGLSGVGDWSDMVEVSAFAGVLASDIVVGRHSDGTCVATGSVATAVAAWRDIVDVAAGYKHAVGLRADGTVVATGDNRYHQCDVSGWTDIVQVAAGLDHTVGLRSDGTVVAAGDSSGWETDVFRINDRARLRPFGPEPVVWIDAGMNMTMGVLANGEAMIIGEGIGEVWDDIATKRPASTSVGGSGDAVGLRFDPGFEVGAEWAALTASYPALAPGQSVKFAVRTSDDGVTYSEPLGYDGRPIDWTDGTGNYLGRAYSDSAARTSLEAAPDAKYLDIVVRLETRDAMTSPVLRDVTVSCREKDVTGPTVSSDAVATYGDSGTVTVTATDDFGLASISYRLDGEATVTVAASGTSATKAVTTGTLGEHSLEFWATDLSGNVSEHGSATFTVVDASAPVVTTDAVASYDETATLTITSTDNFGLASISYRLDGEATATVPAAGLSAETSLTTSALGEHVLEYWATDEAGNVREPVSVTFTVLDAIVPTVACDADGVYDDIALFEVSAADNRGLASISYRLDGEAAVTVPVSGLSASAPVSVAGLGEHTLEYWATDGGGNDSARGVATFTVLDAAAPTVGSDALTTYRDTATIAISASDDRALAYVSYRINGEATVTVEASTATATVPVSITALGEYTLEFWAVDASGNESGRASVSFAVLDGTAPIATVDAVEEYEDLAVLIITATDETALGSISYSLDGAPVVTRPKAGVLGMLAAWTSGIGEHVLEYWATDAAGNESVRGTATFTVKPTDLLTTPTPASGVRRFAGDDRYGTAVMASLEMFPQGAGTVVIASGEDWPDALGGSALAGVVDGPLLLTRSNGLPAEVRDEIVRLGATKVYILGGTGAVSTIAEAEIRGLLGAANVRRIGGADRYETARLIAAEVIWLKGGAYDGMALVASGGTFADALAASPLAAAKGWPILLAEPNGDVDVDGSITSAVVLGGAGAVSQTTLDGLIAALGETHVTRIGGESRYETAALVAAYAADEGALWECVGIARGDDYPDGLAAGVAIGARDGLLLLTPRESLDPSARAALAANTDSIESVYIAGGEGAVSATVEAAVRAALGLE